MLCACFLSDTVPLILSIPCLLGTAAIEFAIPCTQLEPYCFSSKYVGLCSIVRSLDKTSFCSLPCSETVTRGSPTDSPQGAHINATTALISCHSSTHCESLHPARGCRMTHPEIARARSPPLTPANGDPDLCDVRPSRVVCKIWCPLAPSSRSHSQPMGARGSIADLCDKQPAIRTTASMGPFRPSQLLMTRTDDLVRHPDRPMP